MTDAQKTKLFEDNFKNVKKLDTFLDMTLITKRSIENKGPDNVLVFTPHSQERVSFVEDVVPVFLTFSELMNENGISFIKKLSTDSVSEYVYRATEITQRVEDILKESDDEQFLFACVSSYGQLDGKKITGTTYYRLSRDLFLTSPIGYNAFLTNVERFKQTVNVV